jgi:hypothetical protein
MRFEIQLRLSPLVLNRPETFLKSKQISVRVLFFFSSSPQELEHERTTAASS